MALQKQIVAVQLGGGVDTKTDPRQLLPGKMVVLENANLETTKKYKKRPGTQTISSPGSSPKGLTSFQDQLVQFNGTDPYTYSPDLTSWGDAGTFTPVSFTKQSLNRGSVNISNQDVAVDPITGIQCYVWNGNADTGPAYYQIIDGTTGAPLSLNNGAAVQSVPSLSANSIRVKVFVMGSNFVFVGMDSSTKQLFYSYVSIISPTDTASNAAALTTTGNATNFVWDGTVSGGTLYYSYENTSNVISTSFMTQSFTQGVTVSSTASGSKCICTFIDDASRIWVGCSAGTTAKYFIYNGDLSPFLAVTNFGGTWTAAGSVIRNITGVSIGSGQARFFYESSPVTYNYDGFVISGVGTNGGAINSSTNITYGLGLISKPFVYSGTDTYVLTCRKSTLQTTYFLLNQAGKIICKHSQGVASGLNSNGSTSRKITGTLSEVISLSSTKFLTTGIEASVTSETPLTRVTYGVVKCNYEFDAINKTQSVTAQNVKLINGGVLTMYDGSLFCEHGFHFYPEDLTIAVSATAGNYADGNYVFAAVFEWSDAQGNVYQSAPSSSVSFTMAGGPKAIDITVSGLTLTQKLTSSVSIVLYRTPKNSTTAPLQRDQVITNVITSPTFSSTPTTTVEPPTGANLYTTGGVVNNVAPGATKAIALYRNRVVAVPSEQTSSFWYSKTIAPGASTDFSDSFTWNIDTQGGDIVAAAQLDEKLVLGKSDNLFFMSGSGPADTGANNDFSDAQLLPSECGITDLKSVVSMPQGLIFKSRKGIYQLDRGLSSSYIGADVEQYNSSDVTSALLLRDGRTARMTLSTGEILSYNYFINQWSTIPNANGIDACIYQNVYAYLKSDGTVIKETTTFDDSGIPIPLKMQTGWISFSSLQGYQRVYKLIILGDYISADSMVVSIAYDFNPNPAQVVTVNLTNTYGATSTWGSSSTWGSDTLWGGSQFPPMQARVDMNKQKCQAIQVTIEDVQGYNSGEGFEISGLAFEVGIEQGLMRVNTDRQFG